MSTRLGTATRRSWWSWLLIAVLIVMTVVPIVLVLINSLNTAKPGQPAQYGFENWQAAFSDPALWNAVRNTFSLAVPEVLIGLVIATALAWLITRTDMKLRRLFEVLLWLAFFVPPLSMTLGWIVVFDPSTGVFNQVLRTLFGSDATQGPFNVYSFWGIVFVHLCCTTVPFMTILLIPSFQRMGASLEEAGRISGAGRLRTAWHVTLPLMLPALTGAAVLGFIYSLKSFEIEAVLGAPTNLNVISTLVYQWLEQSPPAYGIATALGASFIPVILVIAIAQRFAVKGRDYVTVGGHSFSAAPMTLGRVGRWVAAGVVGLYVLFTVVLPVGAVVLGSFMRRFGFFNIKQAFTADHWTSLLQNHVLPSALWTSLSLGLASAIAGVLVYFVVALAITRTRARGRGTIDILSWLPVGIPGILLGLGLLWLYLATPARTVVYGSLFGLTLAIVISHLPTGTQQMKASLMQISTDQENAARVSGAGPRRAYLHVLFPLMRPAVIATGILTFVIAIRDTSTVALLSSSGTTPASVLMLEYSIGANMESAAAIGVILAGITVAIALIARWIGSKTTW
jgi:iron(III) transport system permease protein